MIKPTVGRVVWFRPFGTHSEPPLAATIAYVHADRLINIGYLNSQGQHRNRTDVELCHEEDARPTHGPFCEWMPFQVGQAKAQTQTA